ncbi:hypothetical protein [Bacillus sp. SM2101]|uniref:hypothetical protein n=1 Tax=Bacillus sp. SM2101 TaxID=2805366 RepID=UPI001BDED908|nr:hypothetical protein [Bacillus sp. SM2101]
MIQLKNTGSRKPQKDWYTFLEKEQYEMKFKLTKASDPGFKGEVENTSLEELLDSLRKTAIGLY